jgi:hypothetical protein
MFRFPAVFAILALGFSPLGPSLLSAQAAPDAKTPVVVPSDQGDFSPYKSGDQAISLSAGVALPLAVLPDQGSGSLGVGAGFGFSYRYFLDRQWAVGGSISGAFNGTPASRSYFTAPLVAELSWWHAFTPFELYLDAGLGLFLSRLDGKGMIGPFATLGGAVMWKTASGWSLGLQAGAKVLPELHSGDYSDLTRTALFLDTGLIALYHL